MDYQEFAAGAAKQAFGAAGASEDDTQAFEGAGSPEGNTNTQAFGAAGSPEGNTDGNMQAFGAAGASEDDLRSWIREARDKKSRSYPRGSSAVLIPFLIRDGSYHVLYEIRAAKLRSQPGEICFPGGRIEAGETPLETAVREATEELCIDRDKIEIVGTLDDTIGPGAIPLFTFIGVLHDYKGTWSRVEVDKIFTLPLDWILSNDPEVYKVGLVRDMPEDFPYEHVPGGRGYRWREQFYSVPFYPQLPTELSLFEEERESGKEAGAEDHSKTTLVSEEIGNPISDAGNGVHMPVLWGVTARVTSALAALLREGRGERKLQ